MSFIFIFPTHLSCSRVVKWTKCHVDRNTRQNKRFNLNTDLESVGGHKKGDSKRVLPGCCALMFNTLSDCRVIVEKKTKTQKINQMCLSHEVQIKLQPGWSISVRDGGECFYQSALRSCMLLCGCKARRCLHTCSKGAKSMMTACPHHIPPGSLALPQCNSASIFRSRTQNTVAK